MVKIIGISGRKQSGKNTTANYINGHVLKSKNMIEDFYIDNEGNLVINTSDQSGKSGYGVLDVVRKDAAFLDYADKELWPYIKVYHFADYLKELSINLFGLNPSQVYGSDKQKNMKTHLRWQDMPENASNKEGKMTNREFLEYFGTSIVRKIRPDAWVHATINKIVAEDSQLAIIPDVRFPNEVEAIKDNGGVVLRLTRDIFKDSIVCESALDKENFDWEKFDHVIDNSAIGIQDLCTELNKLSSLWSL